MVLVKTRVAPNMAGEVGIAAVVVIAEAVIRKPVDCDGVDLPVQERPVDTLEATAGKAKLASIESPVKISNRVTVVAIR